MSAMGKYASRVTDWYMESTMIDSQKSDKPAKVRTTEGLYESNDSRLKERGGYEGHVSESSLYTKASLHPIITGSAIAIGLGGLIYALSRSYSAGENGLNH